MLKGMRVATRLRKCIDPIPAPMAAERALRGLNTGGVLSCALGRARAGCSGTTFAFVSGIIALAVKQGKLRAPRAPTPLFVRHGECAWRALPVRGSHPGRSFEWARGVSSGGVRPDAHLSGAGPEARRGAEVVLRSVRAGLLRLTSSGGAGGSRAQDDHRATRSSRHRIRLSGHSGSYVPRARDEWRGRISDKRVIL